ncbi:MAG TPA: PQQ-binding-like beta-propeller repeat protein, partial [Anaerolineales bacterium]|nr:PQQ-binding-like beta-propeller repeat protein [Anaerolineales bacterium]
SETHAEREDAMNISQHNRVGSLQRGTLTLLMALIVPIGILHACLQKPQPRITHSLGSSTQQVDVLWLKQEILTKITSGGNGTIYAMPISREWLMAINARDGTPIWNTELPLERGGGARGLLTNQNTVFVTTNIIADAYETTTGKLQWSTRLGNGHVSVIPQLDSNILRIYYGGKLIELDPKTGKMLTTIPKDNITWVSGDVVLQSSTTKQVVALDRRSNKSLWTNDRLFYIDEGKQPLDIGDGKLIVGFVRGICALDLRTGKYNWCRPEIYISNLAIDYQSQRGFAMRDDLMLLTIDLHTGKVLGETRFLSSKLVDEQLGFLSSIAFSNGVVVVSFSDSGQTFGLEFK